VRHPQRNRCFVRATKSMLGLPPMRTHMERVPMSAAHEALYGAALGVAAAMVRDQSIRADLAQIGRIVMLLLQLATSPAAVLDPNSPLRMTSERMGVDLDTLARGAASEVVPAKFVRARQLVDDNVAIEEKTLVWANFIHHIESLRTLMADYEPAVIMGSVPRFDPAAASDRGRELVRFRTDPNCRLLLATPQCLGEGVSLHETCTKQIWIDRTYNAGVFMQGIDRTHRLGMDPNADAWAKFLVSEGTIDERIGGRLETKVASMARLLDDPDLLTLALPDFDDTLSVTDLFLDGGNAQDLEDLFAHLRAG
jgi:SNF2 family DNA or RNA helicase